MALVHSSWSHRDTSSLWNINLLPLIGFKILPWTKILTWSSDGWMDVRKTWMLYAQGGRRLLGHKTTTKKTLFPTKSPIVLCSISVLCLPPFLDRLRPLEAVDQYKLYIQTTAKGENGHRNYFMINLHKSYGRAGAGTHDPYICSPTCCWLLEAHPLYEKWTKPWFLSLQSHIFVTMEKFIKH